MVFHLVGELLEIFGRQIERGNTRAAAVGAAVAGLAGGTWTYTAGADRAWDRGWLALAVATGVGAAMAGGFLASFVPSRGAAAVGPSNAAKNDDAVVVRATNYSRALAPTLLCGLAWAAVLAAGICLATDDGRGGREAFAAVAADARVLAIPLLLALLTVASLRAVFWADLGRGGVVVRRLLRATPFPPDELAGWQFLESDSVESMWLDLRLAGRRRPLRLAVRRADLPKAEAVLRRLAAARPAGRQPADAVITPALPPVPPWPPVPPAARRSTAPAGRRPPAAR
jgi:hypothetical protein